MRDTFLTKDTKQQVHKDVRPISSDCETFPLEEQEQDRGPRVVDTGKDVLGRPYDETEIDGEMRKTYSPAGDMPAAATFKPSAPAK